MGLGGTSFSLFSDPVGSQWPTHNGPEWSLDLHVQPGLLSKALSSLLSTEKKMDVLNHDWCLENVFGKENVLKWKFFKGIFIDFFREGERRAGEAEGEGEKVS